MINPSQHKPDHIAAQARPDPEHAARTAWLARARGLHRNKRYAGMVGCVLGASLVLWGRYSTNAPSWAELTGFIVVGVSWLVLMYTIADRWMWVKKNPYRPPLTPAPPPQ
jgi:hypothetical protein